MKKHLLKMRLLYDYSVRSLGRRASLLGTYARGRNLALVQQSWRVWRIAFAVLGGEMKLASCIICRWWPTPRKHLLKPIEYAKFARRAFHVDRVGLGEALFVQPIVHPVLVTRPTGDHDFCVWKHWRRLKRMEISNRADKNCAIVGNCLPLQIAPVLARIDVKHALALRRCCDLFVRHCAGQ